MVEKTQRDKHFKVRADGMRWDRRIVHVEMMGGIYVLPREGIGKNVFQSSYFVNSGGGSCKLRVLSQHREKQHVFKSYHHYDFPIDLHSWVHTL